MTFLAQNYPNPFNPATKIVFGLREPGFVSLRIYDSTGRLVRTLVEGHRASRVFEVLWNGLDERGTPMSSGVYFCRLKIGSFTGLRKMVLLR
jgi:flagellar hook assembly protein FlgD